MIIAIPLAAAAALAIFGLMASRKNAAAAKELPAPDFSQTGEVLDAADATPGGAEVHPETPVSAPPGVLPNDSGPPTGDVGVAHTDDTFDAALAEAIATHNIEALKELAAQAENLGLLTVARSIRDEIARLQSAAPVATPPGPDKPVIPPSVGLATYIVKAGDTGEKIALAFTGDKSRWKELVTVNPSTKDAKIGFKAAVGQRINLPASWPAGVPVPVPPSAAVPSKPASPNTYKVQSGDTGERVAQAFVGDKNRWKELLVTNPSLKDAKYGIALYAGHYITLPNNWPATPGHAADIVAPVATKPVAIPVVTPSTPAQLVNTYTIKSGDTGEKIALAFTGDKSRWRELVTANPSTKDAKIGFKANPGQRINLPASWPAMPGAVKVDIGPATIQPAAPPPPAALPQSDARAAAEELTKYLQSLGGLKARYKENQATVKALQARMGIANPDGKYGVGTVKTILLNGLVPVAPLYWASTGAAKQKSDLTALVKNYAAADPQRAAQWNALLADIVRS